MKDKELTDNEAKLQKLLRSGLPPERDPLFRIAVVERRERRTLRRRIAATVAAGGVATILASLAMTAIVDSNADLINAWLTGDRERVLVALTVVATACFTLSAVWLAAADSARGAMRTLRTWFWV